MHAAVSYYFTQQVYKKRVLTCMHNKFSGLCGNLTSVVRLMSLNLCRRNLEDQFLFPTCQGLLHVLLPPGFAVDENLGSWSERRSSLSPILDVGYCTHFLFVFFFLFLSPSATVKASKPPSGNSAAFRR